MSTQRIRDWMAAHPDEAAKVRATNRSYVFFRVTGLSNEGEPVGAQGVPLTPGRSIAVDRLHEYGTPFFIEANLPIESVKPASPFRRLMIAQDTGSAIVGPARADLVLGRRRRCRPHRRSHSPSRPLRDAASTRARHGRGRQSKCRCRCRNRGSPARGQRNRTARARRSPPAPALTTDGRSNAVAGAEDEGRRDRSQEAGRQRQGGACQRRRERSRQEMPLPALKTEGHRDRSQRSRTLKAKPNSASSGEIAGRQADGLAGAEDEEPRDRSHQTGRQGQSGFRQRRRGWESGGKAGPASRFDAKELPLNRINRGSKPATGRYCREHRS